MTLEEWIERYNKKTPEPFKRDERYEFFFLPDKGFCEVGQDGDMIIIHQLCGDARFWKEKVSEMARKIGAAKCGTWCVRQEVLAYIRLFGYKIYKREKTTEGLTRYYGIQKDTGKKGLMSPAFRFETGEQAYFVTWEP
jgi:hypothetical protein